MIACLDCVLDFIINYWEFILSIIITAIVSIIITSIFQKSIKPFYATLTSKVFKESEIAKQNKIKIFYKDNVVKTLTITKLAFWNSGKQTLKYNDHIAEKDPFRIELHEEGEILDYELLYQKEANDIKPILKDNRIIYIPFNYFSHNEGFVIKIYHTGKTGEQIEMHGSLKEDAIIERVVGIGNRVVPLPLGLKISKNVFFRISGLICAFVAIWGVVFFLRRNGPLMGNDYFFAFILVTYMILGVFGVLFFIKSFKVTIPKIMRDKLFDD